MEEPPLTAAELLRRRVKRKDSSVNTNGDNQNAQVKNDVNASSAADDIDDEIQRLEQELNDDTSSSASDDDSSSVAPVDSDRIEPLPAKYLPTATSKRLRVDDEGEIVKKKKKKNRQRDDDVSTIDPKQQQELQAVIKQTVVQNYVARSSEKLPFYCRYCQKQYTNEQEFLEHKSLEFHKVAVQVERKATFCKLCRKQLTSPTQMQEHLSSRPHKELLEYKKQQQQQGGGGRGRGRGGNQWNGRQGRGQGYPGRGGRGGDTRQWV